MPSLFVGCGRATSMYFMPAEGEAPANGLASYIDHKHGRMPPSLYTMDINPLMAPDILADITARTGWVDEYINMFSEIWVENVDGACFVDEKLVGSLYNINMMLIPEGWLCFRVGSSAEKGMSSDQVEDEIEKRLINLYHYTKQDDTTIEKYYIKTRTRGLELAGTELVVPVVTKTSQVRNEVYRAMQKPAGPAAT